MKALGRLHALISGVSATLNRTEKTETEAQNETSQRRLRRRGFPSGKGARAVPKRGRSVRGNEARGCMKTQRETPPLELKPA